MNKRNAEATLVVAPSVVSKCQSPIGILQITTIDSALNKIEFERANATIEIRQHNFHQEIINQLQAYFSRKSKSFTLAVQLIGTPFQRKVWQALIQIPYGRTKTYGQLAKELNTAPMAIGQACKFNPVPIVIPCHRVVAMDGIGGYFGKTDGIHLTHKQWLLNHESQK